MSKKNIAIILFVSFGVAIFASFFASSHPDGLEWVAEKLGFIENATGTPGIMPDYSCPFIKEPIASTMAAGIGGSLLMFGLFWLGSKLALNIKKRSVL